MYAPSSNTSQVNKLRYELFCAKRGEADSSQLPFCEDSLRMHSQRANYQAAIWRRSLQCAAYVPHPKDHGWTVSEDGQLEINWICGLPAPLAVLELLSAQLISSIRRTRNPKLVPIGRKRTSAQIREINVKKLQFIHMLTGTDLRTSKTAKIKKLRLSRGESVLTLSLVIRKVSVIAVSPNVRRLLIKVLTVFEAFQQTAYEIFLCAIL